MASKTKQTEAAAKAEAEAAPKPEAVKETPAVAKPGCVAFGSRFTRYRLTLAPGDNKTPAEVVQFENGRVDVSDKKVVEKMRAHPLLGNEFHELGEG
jgi:hypothetical protein